MFEALAFFAMYGMGIGTTVAIHHKVLGDWDGVEFLVAGLWPVTLPAILMWWVVNSWIGGEDG
jgi:hypothetical protein